jgi:NOL1/NOP2/fmu family ribosome biogenesis protein
MLRFIRKSEKEKLLKKLEYYGIKKLPYLLTISGQDKIRGYSGAFSEQELADFTHNIGMDIMGLYLFHEHRDEIRIGFDAVIMLKDQITKNILELTEAQAKECFKGQDILLTNEEKEKLKDEPRGFKILKLNNEFIGTGKLTQEGRIVNYMPKERRIK